MFEKQISILLIEDDTENSGVVQSTLSLVSDVSCQSVVRVADAVKLLKQKRFDLVILDLCLPDAQELPIILVLQDRCPEMPIIVLAGPDAETRAAEAVRLGAEDYLLKSEITPNLLYRSIYYSIERKRAREMSKQLLLMKQREDFIATLTHDLKNPLIGAEKMLELLQECKLGVLTDKQLQVIDLLRKSNREQLDMIQQLLEVYRYEAGVQALTFQNVDLVSLINDCVAELNPVAESRDLQIHRLLSGDLKSIWADSHAIRRVVRNLLLNAIKFSPEGGRIDVVGKRNEEQVEVSVKDEGVGIPEVEAGMLFQRFVQGSAGKGHTPGTGLGLYLSRRIVEAHGGQLDCASQEGKGSVFVVRLPLFIPAT
jgi:signal transduction histidine kinase